MEAYLSAPRRGWLERVRTLAEARGLPLYLVGGFVRDLLLGLPPDDFDLVVEGAAPILARAAAREWGGEMIVHAPFGTATWTAPDGVAMDFASARTETYPQPASLPQVQTPTTIAHDLQRRDFSINAIALRLDGAHFGELLDPHNGQADLAARAVRVLHERSFRDDPTRLFRAVRYEQRLGFNIAAETLALIPDTWEALDALTADRVRREFELIFREANASATLSRLSELGILARVHPALKWGESESARAGVIAQLPWVEWKLSAPPEPEALYWALLLEAASDLDAALQRFNLNRAMEQAVREAIALQKNWSRPSEAVAVLDQLAESGVVAAYALRPDWRADLHAYLARWRFVRAATTGADLIARGLTPGPHFKPLLWELRAARLDGNITDLEGERALIEHHLARKDRAG
jgi:tRNA nucleotidyltransferase (CCA-adding enzyme)